jgi:hypothetical protein
VYHTYRHIDIEKKLLPKPDVKFERTVSATHEREVALIVRFDVTFVFPCSKVNDIP